MMALLCVAVFVASVVQACTGFGFAMVVAAPLLFVYPPAVAVPLVGLLSMPNTAYVGWHCRRSANLRRIALLLGGAFIGMPVGVYCLKTLDGPLIKVAVGVLMLILAVLLLKGWRRPVRNETVAWPGVGLVSGFLGGSTSLTGPPVILFLANQDTEKDEFRATIVAYFLVLGMGTAGVFAWQGLITREVLVAWAVLVPAMLLGLYLGARLGDRISETHFRRVVMVCIGLMGAVLIGVNIRGLEW